MSQVHTALLESGCEVTHVFVEAQEPQELDIGQEDEGTHYISQALIVNGHGHVVSERLCNGE